MLMILLFDNPIQKISTDSWEGLSNYTKVYISCNSLSQISEIQNMKLVVRCSLSVSIYLFLRSSSDSAPKMLCRLGFDCRKEILGYGAIHQHNCTPCPLGYYGGSIGDSPCRPCPPGSFYHHKLVQKSS